MSVKSPRSEVSVDLLDGAGAVSLPIESWSISRDLKGGGLPAQARSATGFAGASGSIEIVMGDEATPWRSTLSPGGRASILAAADVSDALARVATMEIRDIEAEGALTPRRTLRLGERLDGLRKPVSLAQTIVPQWTSETGAARFDAAWAISQAARAGGYYTTPTPGSGCLLSVPLTGSVAPEVGTLGGAGAPEHTWDDTGGGEMVARSSNLFSYNLANSVDIRQPVYMSWDTSFPGRYGLGYNTVTLSASPAVDTGGGPTLNLVMRYTGTAFGSGPGIGVTAALYRGTGLPAEAYVAGPPIEARYKRVEVHVEWTGVNAAGTSFTGYRIRARYDSGAWSAWSAGSFGLTVSLPAVPDWTALMNNTDVGGVSGLQIHTSPSAKVWTQPRTTRIAPSGVLLDYAVADSARSGWDLIQDVARSTMGAAWIDEDGVLTYRNRGPLRGATTPTETIVASESLADVPWSISRDDVADRIEVAYQPVSVERVTNYSLTIWRAEREVVRILPGRTARLRVDLDAAVADLAPIFGQRGPDGFIGSTMSQFNVSLSPNGGGSTVGMEAVSATAELQTPTRLHMVFTNRRAETVYLVNAAGDPSIVVRANLRVTPLEPVTVELGRPIETAANPLEVNLGSWVQGAPDAQAIATWLQDATQRPLPVLRDVRVLPNPARRLGSVAILRDDQTGISAKVLISGKTDSERNGALEQTLTLTVLDTTIFDVNRAWVGMTFADLNALFAGMTFADVNRYLAKIGGL